MSHFSKASREGAKLAKGKKLTDQAVKSSPKALHCTNCGIDDEASRKGATLARMQLKYNLAQSRRAESILNASRQYCANSSLQNIGSARLARNTKGSNSHNAVVS